ncbi:Glutathione S-transferase, C-terminal domain [Popillia japonica]|uniref:Glutathione S-transferase, C-terminal domain n=1 Tax=Popillia japonica TaxID=7064 RepID=A0AAW1JXB9_POPJA
MAPVLYMNDISPAVRSVLLLTKALNIELELEYLDLTTGQHMTPHFLRINPQHTVPTLVDNGFVVWDSHAINAYLVNVYSEDKSLYPTNPQKRATVDQRLHFHSGILFPKYAAIIESIIKEGAKVVTKERIHSLTNVYNILETLLETSPYIAGKQLTIADFAVISTITSANILVPLAENRFPAIWKWIEKMKQLPYYHEANEVGLEKFAVWIKSKLG